MGGSINLTAVYVANGMGIVTALLFLFGNKWQISASEKEKKTINMMLALTMFVCMVDCVIFAADGLPGRQLYWIVYISNLIEYIANLIVGPMWAVIIISHINGSVPKGQILFIHAMLFIGIVLLVLNFFYPMVFVINENNAYERGPLFFMFLGIEYLLIIDGFLYYVIAKIKGGIFLFFPVWQFFMPMLIGIIVQSLVYGISTIWPFMAISAGGVVIGLRNEMAYQDQLTGLYNRAYLYNIQNEIRRSSKSKVTAMLLDMNNFKVINDRFGHMEGDVALVKTGKVLMDSVSVFGNAIRYAGDEFVILLNTQKKEIVEKCISDIHSGLDKINKEDGKEYVLSVSIGTYECDLKKQTMDDVLNEVDKRMYDAKRAYYTANPRRNRRSENRS